MSCRARITHESGHLEIYFSFIVAHTHLKKAGSLIQDIQLTFLDADRIPNLAAAVLLLTTVAGLALAQLLSNREAHVCLQLMRVHLNVVLENNKRLKDFGRGNRYLNNLYCSVIETDGNSA